MTRFPPSINTARHARAPDPLTGHLEQMTEREKKRGVRIAAVEAALIRLPLRPAGDEEVHKMLSLFEQTYYAVQRTIKVGRATTPTMEDELSVLAKGLKKVADHVESLHPDTLRTWAAGTNVAANGIALLLIIRTAEEWAELSADTLQKAKRVGGPGRTVDRMAMSMRETAEFVYERLTNRKANIAYDAYAGAERETPFVAFLESIYEAYGVKASAKSHARKRKPMARK